MRALRNLLLTATALVPIGAMPAIAGPNGATVVGGSANIQNPGSANVTVNQFSDKAIINWRMFDIGVGEKTTFVQPNSSSIALNRVTGGLGPSQILGSLDANGRVFVVNRDGIIFGAGAVINTAGFLATTSDIKNEDFMAGRFNFQIPGKPDASIVNMGTITAASGGFAALVAPGVRNSGTITAKLGTVALGAGNIFNLDFYGDRLITLGVGDQIASEVKDVATGQTLKSLVTNEGKLKANGGRVELTAAAARQVVDSVINTSGVIEANSIGTHNGQIVLSAATAAPATAGRGEAGTASASLPPQKVKVSGTLSAAGKKKGTKGGSIIVTGEHIELAGATIDASGRDGGGKVLIGGDWGGGKPDTSLVSNQSAKLESGAIPNATTVSVDAATRIDASAKDKGDGGKVVLWANDQLTFAGTILALGGKEIGNGGFIETSSHGLLNGSGTVNAGRGGTWLLDPPNQTVDTSLATTIQNALTSGTNFTLNTGASGPGDGDIIFNSSVRIAWNTSATLTLIAFRNIQFNDGGTGPEGGGNIVNYGGAAGNLVMRADSTGTGTGTILMPNITFATRVNWNNSTGNVSLYYNPTVFGTQDSFTTFNQIVVASASQRQQYMLVNTTAQLGSIGTNATTLGEKYAIGPATLNASGFTGINGNFTGVLDGDGALGTKSTIANLDSTARPTGGGLFSIIASGGVVRNLNITGFSFISSGSFSTGAVAGFNSGTISNVSAAGTMTGTAPVTFGGLVAVNSGVITQSSAAVDITIGNGTTGPGGFNYAGGLAGQNAGTISTSSASGNVAGGTNSFVGGLVGQNGTGFGGTITASATSGNVTGGGAVGGLVGFNSSSASIVTGASTGNVSGTASSAMVGGLVGQNEGSIANSTHTTGAISGNGSGSQNIILGGLVGSNNAAGTVQDSSVNSTSITAPWATAGGLVGTNSGHVTGTSLGQVSANTTITLDGLNSTAGGLVGQNGANAVIHNATASGSLNRGGSSSGLTMNFGGLVGWNLGSIDNSTASTVVNGGPGTAGGFAGQNEGSISASSASGNVSGTGVSSQFIWIGGLIGDNRPTGTLSSVSVAAGQQVSTGGLASIGGLIGNNSANVSNLSAGNTVLATGVNVSIGGLVGWNNAGATITNGASTASVTGGDSSFVGGLVGQNFGSIVNSSASGPASGGSFSLIGGLVGYNGGSITNSSTTSGQVSVGTFSEIGGLVGANAGAINESQSSTIINAPNTPLAGGLVGTNQSGASITNSSASGNVSGSSLLGGLVGANGGSISGSSATGNVTGGPDATMGGLVGFNFGGTIDNSKASGVVSGGSGGVFGGLVGTSAFGTISNSFATGAVSVDSGVGGGLVGSNMGTITGSHASGAVTGNDGSFVGGLAGFNIAGTIANSFSVSNVTTGAGGGAGGLVAINFGAISQSFATGKVTGGDNSYVGGLVAFNFGDISAPGSAGASGGPTLPVGAISQSYATGAVTGGANSVAGGLVAENAGSIDQGYAAGRVIGGAGSVTGGLVASNNFTVPGGNPLFPTGLSGTPGTATNSYWDTQTTGQSGSAGGTGAQTTQLVNVIPNGFTTSTWSTSAGKYPFFTGQPDPLPVPGDPVTTPPVTIPPVTTPPVTIPQQQPQQTPDNTVTVNVTTIAPLVNIAAMLAKDLGIDKKPDLVITNQSGPTGGAGQGSGSPGGQKGGANPGGARPPANVVAAFGLGPLPSGMPPLNETRFRNDEAVFQLGGRLSDGELAALLRELKLEVLFQEDVGLLGRKVLRVKLPAGATVRGIIAAFEKKGANFSGQPAYQYEMVQDVAQAPSPADTSRKGDSAQYVVEKLGLPEAHLIATGKDVKVAVIDSEIDANHPDLQGAVTGSYDALPSDDQSAHPHGTGMAGAIASHKRLLGIAPNAHLLAVRAFGVNTGGAQGTSVNIVKGLQWAVDQGAKVINMSFAGPKDPILQQAIKRLTDQGIILIAAAGNAGPKSPPLFPGADPNVIAVSATDMDDKTYKGANRGKYIAIAAPGVDILVPAPEGGYQLTTGTSVAAAHISGVVALMLERNKELKPSEVRSILAATAKNIGGVKTDVGAGLVDPVAALAKSGPKQALAR